MNEFSIEIFHPNLDTLSDRTLRFVLKRTAVLIREIQLAEVLAVVDDLDLTNTERQSVRDHLIAEISQEPAYYIERIDRGSLTIFGFSTMGAWWLLDKTIGASVSEAWKKTATHKKLVEILSMPLGRRHLEAAVEQSEEFANYGRMAVDSYAYDAQQVRLRLELITSEAEATGQMNRRIDTRFVLDEIEREIRLEE